MAGSFSNILLSSRFQIKHNPQTQAQHCVLCGCIATASTEIKWSYRNRVRFGIIVRNEMIAKSSKSRSVLFSSAFHLSRFDDGPKNRETSHERFLSFSPQPCLASFAKPFLLVCSHLSSPDRAHFAIIKNYVKIEFIIMSQHKNCQINNSRKDLPKLERCGENDRLVKISHKRSLHEIDRSQPAIEVVVVSIPTAVFFSFNFFRLSSFSLKFR